MPVIVDTSHLQDFCKRIAAMPPLGTNAWNVMLHEVARILENCVRLTTRANVERIKRSIAFKNRTLMGPGSSVPIVYITKAGIAWYADFPGAQYEGVAKGKRAGGRTFHPMTEFFRYGQPRWSRYQQLLMDLKNKQIDVRAVLGRAGQTWVQMADAAGIPLTGIPAYIRDAPAFKGNTKRHGLARKFRNADSMWLEMINQGRIMLGTIDGNRILQTSINGRYQYFRRNMEHGVFEDVKQIARAYPSLKVAA